MLKILKKPYPFNNDLNHNAKVAFFISIVIFALFFFFEPFNINDLTTKQKAIISAYVALITFATLAFNMVVLPAYFKKIFSPKHWNVMREILWDSWLLLTVAAAYFVYFYFNPIMKFNFVDIAKILLVAIFAIAILISLNYQRLLKINLKAALELNEKMGSKPQELFEFKSDYKKDNFKISIDKILFLKSSGNYVEIHYLEDDNIKKHLIRSSLKKIEQDLSQYNFMYRCHRSYIVNINFIIKAEADSQGLKLQIKNLSKPIPVSKNYIEGLNKIL